MQYKLSGGCYVIFVRKLKEIPCFKKSYARGGCRVFRNYITIGLASTLALKGNTDEAIELMERGLPISNNEKQKATMRATLCFLYLKAGYEDKANRLASELPHTRESREVIQPRIQQGLTESEINENIKKNLKTYQGLELEI